VRLFIAARVDDASSRQIVQAMDAVRRAAPRASWVGEHAYHLTFAFLGEQDEMVARRVSTSLPGALESTPGYEGALSGGGFFPDDRRPRVGWLGFTQPQPLRNIAGSVRGLLEELRVSFDRKAFRPHLTLVRIRDRWSGRDVSAFLHAADALGPLPVIVRRVTLFRSELQPGGAKHEPLAEVELS